MAKTFLARILKEYNLQVKEKNPIKAKMFTAFCLFGSGDITCQILERQSKWDYVRTLRMASVAGLV